MNGLIVYSSKSRGRVIIGDEVLRTTFTNLTGAFNPVTFDQVDLWDPATWNQVAVDTVGENLRYGLGSVLFNLHKSNNNLNITVRNVDFKWIYGKGQGDQSLPLILKAGAGDGFTRLHMRIEDVTIQHCTFEQGSAFFESK